MKPEIDHTHAPTLTSWVDGADGHPDFPIQNLPLGVFSPSTGRRRIGVAIGDMILDLSAVARAGLTQESLSYALRDTALNALFAAPSRERRALRHALSDLLSKAKHEAAVRPLLHRAADCTLHLPAKVGDYTDFYVGIHHAENVGRLFRPDNPLLPNYKYVPIGYHGRASSIQPSGAPVVRPHGQRKPPGEEVPVFGPSQRLDYELELGVWIGPGNRLGEAIPIREAAEHVAGLCVLNDWSARDLQAWEYQPLGPFLAKNFHSTVSCWVVTMEALAPFFIPPPPRPAGDPAPLPYLSDAEDAAAGALAIELEVWLSTARMRDEGAPPQRLSHGRATSMYWTLAQMVTHHASNGCNLTPGDLLGTGTLSGPTKDGYGSLLEITRGGAEPLTLPNGEARTFLEDGDEVTLVARAAAAGFASLGFGACTARIVS